jgi:hypothetical protein
VDSIIISSPSREGKKSGFGISLFRNISLFF